MSRETGSATKMKTRYKGLLAISWVFLSYLAMCTSGEEVRFDGYTWEEEVGLQSSMLPEMDEVHQDYGEVIMDAIPFGFPFPYYETEQHWIEFNSQGVLMLDDETGNGIYYPNTRGVGPGDYTCGYTHTKPSPYTIWGNVVAPYWTQLHENVANDANHDFHGLMKYGRKTNETIVLHWENMMLAEACSPPNTLMSMEAIFHKTGDFEFRYFNMPGQDSNCHASIGFQFHGNYVGQTFCKGDCTCYPAQGGHFRIKVTRHETIIPDGVDLTEAPLELTVPPTPTGAFQYFFRIFLYFDGLSEDDFRAQNGHNVLEDTLRQLWPFPSDAYLEEYILGEGGNSRRRLTVADFTEDLGDHPVLVHGGALALARSRGLKGENRGNTLLLLEIRDVFRKEDAQALLDQITFTYQHTDALKLALQDAGLDLANTQLLMDAFSSNTLKEAIVSPNKEDQKVDVVEDKEGSRTRVGSPGLVAFMVLLVVVILVCSCFLTCYFIRSKPREDDEGQTGLVAADQREQEMHDASSMDSLAGQPSLVTVPIGP